MVRISFRDMYDLMPPGKRLTPEQVAHICRKIITPGDALKEYDRYRQRLKCPPEMTIPQRELLGRRLIVGAILSKMVKAGWAVRHGPPNSRFNRTFERISVPPDAGSPAVYSTEQRHLGKLPPKREPLRRWIESTAKPDEKGRRVVHVKDAIDYFGPQISEAQAIGYFNRHRFRKCAGKTANLVKVALAREDAVNERVNKLILEMDGWFLESTENETLIVLPG